MGGVGKKRLEGGAGRTVLALVLDGGDFLQKVCHALHPAAPQPYRLVVRKLNRLRHMHRRSAVSSRGAERIAMHECKA